MTVYNIYYICYSERCYKEVDLYNNKSYYMSHCQNSSKFLSIAYFMKTADVIMFFFSSYDRTNHTC